MTSRMRVVSPDERPKKAKILSLAEAIESGDYLQILLAQRREIARALPEEKGQSKATLHRQLRDISKEIEALESEAAGEHSVVASTDDDAWDSSAI